MAMQKIWFVSVLLTVVVVLSLTLTDDGRPIVNMGSAEVAVVGTSLLGRGIEWDASLLGSIPDSRRLALPGATTESILDTSEKSLAQGAKVLVIEAQPFFRVLKHRKFISSTWIHPVIGNNRHLNRFSNSFRCSIYKIVGFGVDCKNNQWLQGQVSEPGDIKIDIDLLERIYPPLIIPTPLARRLDKLLTRARTEGVQNSVSSHRS